MIHDSWDLEDLLADLLHARKSGDLGRLVFVAYCDVRRWARDSGRHVLAEQAARLITESPHQSREAFLVQIDTLIHELEAVQRTARAHDQNRTGESGHPAPKALRTWQAAG
jgi:hypothetical protein